MMAYAQGAEIERLDLDSPQWKDDPNPTWSWNYNASNYRVKKETQAIPDYVNVAAVHIDWKWAATCRSGLMRLYQNKPVYDGEDWKDLLTNDCVIVNRVFSSFERGTVFPENSLMDLDAVRREIGIL